MSSDGSITRDLIADIGAHGADNGPGSAGRSAGDLSRKKSDGKLEFGFEYRRIPFVVQAVANNQGTDMSLRASLGNLPFTAEDPERRATAIAILEIASSDLGGRIRLTREQRLVLDEQIRLDEPLTPSVLLTRTATVVLRAKPYLELLALVIDPPVKASPPPPPTVS